MNVVFGFVPIADIFTLNISTGLILLKAEIAYLLIYFVALISSISDYWLLLLLIYIFFKLKTIEYFYVCYVFLKKLKKILVYFGCVFFYPIYY